MLLKKNWYTIMGHKYHVPNIGYQIKLWDFDFACIPGVIENSKVYAEWTTHINVIPEQNRYYDIHYFFNTLIKKPFFPQFMNDSLIPNETKEFINRIVPLEYQVHEKNVHKRGRFLLKHEFVIPRDILENDPYFEEFRKKKKPISYNNKSNCENYNNKKESFNSILKEINYIDKEEKNKNKLNMNDMIIEELILEKIYNRN